MAGEGVRKSQEEGRRGVRVTGSLGSGRVEREVVAAEGCRKSRGREMRLACFALLATVAVLMLVTQCANKPS